MTDLAVDQVEENLRIQQQLPLMPSTINLIPEFVHFYEERADETKIKIDNLGAEVEQRQAKMRHVNDIITEINNLIKDKDTLDISQNAALLEKMQVARQLGVNLDNKVKFNPEERNRLLENLHLTATGWEQENKIQTQKMDIYIRDLDRCIMMAKEGIKAIKRATDKMIDHISK